MAATSGYNYFIVLTLLLVATAGIATLAGVNELTLKKILLYEIAVVFAVLCSAVHKFCQMLAIN
jgi:hypothetical protein